MLFLNIATGIFFFYIPNKTIHDPFITLVSQPITFIYFFGHVYTICVKVLKVLKNKEQRQQD